MAAHVAEIVLLTLATTSVLTAAKPESNLTISSTPVFSGEPRLCEGRGCPQALKPPSLTYVTTCHLCNVVLPTRTATSKTTGTTTGTTATGTTTMTTVTTSITFSLTTATTGTTTTLTVTTATTATTSTTFSLTTATTGTTATTATTLTTTLKQCYVHKPCFNVMKCKGLKDDITGCSDTVFVMTDTDDDGCFNKYCPENQSSGVECNGNVGPYAKKDRAMKVYVPPTDMCYDPHKHCPPCVDRRYCDPESTDHVYDCSKLENFLMCPENVDGTMAALPSNSAYTDKQCKDARWGHAVAKDSKDKASDVNESCYFSCRRSSKLNDHFTTVKNWEWRIDRMNNDYVGQNLTIPKNPKGVPLMRSTAPNGRTKKCQPWCRSLPGHPCTSHPNCVDCDFCKEEALCHVDCYQNGDVSASACMTRRCGGCSECEKPGHRWCPCYRIIDHMCQLYVQNTCCWDNITLYPLRYSKECPECLPRGLDPIFDGSCADVVQVGDDYMEGHFIGPYFQCPSYNNPSTWECYDSSAALHVHNDGAPAWDKERVEHFDEEPLPVTFTRPDPCCTNWTNNEEECKPCDPENTTEAAKLFEIVVRDGDSEGRSGNIHPGALTCGASVLAGCLLAFAAAGWQRRAQRDRGSSSGGVREALRSSSIENGDTSCVEDFLQ